MKPTADLPSHSASFLRPLLFKLFLARFPASSLVSYSFFSPGKCLHLSSVRSEWTDFQGCTAVFTQGWRIWGELKQVQFSSVDIVLVNTLEEAARCSVRCTSFSQKESSTLPCISRQSGLMQAIRLVGYPYPLHYYAYTISFAFGNWVWLCLGREIAVA